MRRDGFSPLAGMQLLVPPLLWPEVRSVLHRAAAVKRLSPDVALNSRRRFEQMPIQQADPTDLAAVVWQIADDLGWTKTYDAEYLAVAQLLGAPLLTLDARLRRAADRLGIEAAEV